MVRRRGKIMSVIFFAFILKAIIFLVTGIGAIYACEEKWTPCYTCLGISGVLLSLGFFFFGA
jgi:hypothetical protein